MTQPIHYKTSTANANQIKEHLYECDNSFTPRLSERVSIEDYANKIKKNATIFEAWSEQALIGMVAIYCNDTENHIAYITNVSVLPNWKGQGIANNLLEQCIQHTKTKRMKEISLDVSHNNTPAINLYKKNGFKTITAHDQPIRMNLQLQ